VYTHMIPAAQISTEHIRAAIEKIDSEGVPPNRASTKFEILFNSRKYPPKYVVSVAAKLATGKELLPNEFSGGEETNSFLRERGFEVVPTERRTIRENLEHILARYVTARGGEPIGKEHEVWGTFEELQEELAELVPVKSRTTLKVSWSAGQGVWAKVPWIAFLDSKETTTTQKGVYGVILFRQDASGLYLTLNQGVTEPRERLGAREGRKFLRDRVATIRGKVQQIANAGFQLDDEIDLRADPGLGAEYATSTIAYKLYEKGQVPEDGAIAADLAALLSAYDEYLTMTENTSNIWIFQASPKYYDIQGAIRTLTEQTWLVSAHKNRIRAGHRAYLWEAGDEAGIVATAHVVTDPADIPMRDQERQFVRNAEKFDGLQTRVVLRIDRVLDRPLLRKNLLKDPVLSKLQVIAFPRATNYEVTAEQAERIEQMLNNGPTPPQPASPPPPDIDQAIQHLIASIAADGFVFEPWQVGSYVAALKTKPFVILAGITGTGKSKLPTLVARNTGGKAQLTPVRPDWTDSSDLLGYCDLQGVFRPGSLIRLAHEAIDNPDRHYVCILDEMNLARVEQYFAEVLSRIEDRSPGENGGFKTSELLSQMLLPVDQMWGEIYIPANLAVVGTVNMDESSHGFSRKVLDRAFTIELSDVDLTTWQNNVNVSAPEHQSWNAATWYPRAISLPSLAHSQSEEKEIGGIIQVLVEVNGFLSQAQLQIGYRTRDEIALFVLHASSMKSAFATSGGTKVDPLDLALHMKVLPRISGGSGAIRMLLLQMLGWARSGQPLVSEDEAKNILDDWHKESRPNAFGEARFPRTTARLCLMWERFISEGFTSFWL
jgi:hypothetical protein